MYSDRKQISGCLGLCRGLARNGAQRNFGGGELTRCISVGVVVLWAYKFVRIHQNEHSKWTHFKSVQPLWETVWKCLKKLKIELSYDPAIPHYQVYIQRKLNHMLERQLHCNIAHNSPDMEAAWASTNGWKDKENVQPTDN